MPLLMFVTPTTPYPRKQIVLTLIGLLLIANGGLSTADSSFDQAVSAVINFFLSIFGSTKYTAGVTLGINGTIRLQNGSAAVPNSDGSYWPSDLGSPSTSMYVDVTPAIKAMLKAFYVSTGFGSSSSLVIINGYRPGLNVSPSATSLDYTLKFDIKDALFLDDFLLGSNSNSSSSASSTSSSLWTKDSLQKMINLTTSILSARHEGENASAMFASPFSWNQVIQHEVVSLINGGQLMLTLSTIPSCMFAVVVTMFLTSTTLR